jgi:hypothetical protein
MPSPNPVGGCAGTIYGCCLDLITPKMDTLGTNCPGYKPVGGCAGTIYGCCPDQITPKMDTSGTNCPKPAS